MKWYTTIYLELKAHEKYGKNDYMRYLGGGGAPIFHVVNFLNEQYGITFNENAGQMVFLQDYYF